MPAKQIEERRVKSLHTKEIIAKSLHIEERRDINSTSSSIATTRGSRHTVEWPTWREGSHATEWTRDTPATRGVGAALAWHGGVGEGEERLSGLGF